MSTQIITEVFRLNSASIRMSLILVCTSFLMFGQVSESLERKLNKAAPDCYDIGYNAQKIVPEFYEAKEFDSIISVLDYWEKNCGELDAVKYGNILLDIKYEEFVEAKYSDLLQLLVGYRETVEYTSGNYFYYDRRSQEIINAQNAYHAFLKSFAGDLLAEQNHPGIEKDILNFFAGNFDSLTAGLEKGHYEGSSLQKTYNDLINELIYDKGMMMGLYAGSWSPTGNLSTVGTHPEIGFVYGGYKDHYGIDFIAGVRFVDSPNDYRIRKDDSTYVSNHFASVTVGLQGYYSLLKGFKNELALAAGLGYDGITIQSSDEDSGAESVSVGTLNINLGLQYRLYYDLKNYLAFDVRYHYLNFKNNINGELAGHAITGRLVYGFTSSHARQRKLRALGY